MKWINEIWKLFSKRKSVMAMITLDDIDEKKFEFDSGDLIYINYDPELDLIVLCLKGRIPKYLPKTDGNLNYLYQILPHLAASIKEQYNYLKPKFPTDRNTLG